MRRVPARLRTRLERAAAERNREQVARLGSEAREARVRRRVTQEDLGARVGLSQTMISRAERGLGGSLTVDAWQRLAIALGIPLRISLARDPLGDTADAAHLAMQELLLSLARGAGFRGRFELATRPLQPVRSVDVGLLDDGDALVSWWRRRGQGEIELVMRRVGTDGTLGEPLAVTTASVGQPADVPQLAIAGNAAIVAWTDPSDERVRTVRVPL